MLSASGILSPFSMISARNNNNNNTAARSRVRPVALSSMVLHGGGVMGRGWAGLFVFLV